MSSLANLLLPCFLASAGAPGALEEALTTAGDEARLPVGFALDVAPRLGLTFHHQEDWSFAFFVPAASTSSPNLVLYAPFYLRGLGLTPLADLRVDTADYLFHALARAYLEIEGLGGRSPLGQALRGRAEEAFEEVPAGQRLDAYLDAASSFVSHALSVAVELERKHREWEAEGRSLCPDSGDLPLFALWERIFRDEPYQGSYLPPEPSGGLERRSVYSHSTLEREDKEMLMGTLLGGAWKGLPSADFQHFCNPARSRLE